MFFSVPEGCHRRKGKQCLLKLWNTIVSLDNCLMSRTEKWSTGCACDILQMPVLVLRAALCLRGQFLTFTLGLAPFGGGPFHQSQPQPQGVFWHLLQTNCLKLCKFQMPHFCMHLHRLRVWVDFTVKARLADENWTVYFHCSPCSTDISIAIPPCISNYSLSLPPYTDRGSQDFSLPPRSASRRMVTRMVRSWVKERIYIKSHFPYKVQSLTLVNEENTSSL